MIIFTLTQKQKNIIIVLNWNYQCYIKYAREIFYRSLHLFSSEIQIYCKNPVFKVASGCSKNVKCQFVRLQYTSQTKNFILFWDTLKVCGHKFAF